jgi:predicted RNA binding protein YcfA (HicA-like mRNA interferase family)
MASIGNIPGLQVVKAFEQFGFVLDRITGSHHILKKDGHAMHLSVPVHGSKPVRKGTLRALIADAGVTEEAFLAQL